MRKWRSRNPLGAPGSWEAEVGEPFSALASADSEMIKENLSNVGLYGEGAPRSQQGPTAVRHGAVTLIDGEDNRYILYLSDRFEISFASI